MSQMIDVIDLMRHSGLRPFDWRHRACETLCVPGHKYLREVHVNDPAVREYHQFLKLRRYLAPSTRLPLDYSHLRPILDKFKAAYLLQFRQEHRALRSELRARVLANQPRDDIALATGLPMIVIENYERYYFDVRDCLDATAYMWGMMNAKPDEGCDADELQRLAYGGGLQVLEAVLLAERSKDPRWQTLLVTGFRDELDRNMSLRQLMAGSQPIAGAVGELLGTLLGSGAAGLASLDMASLDMARGDRPVYLPATQPAPQPKHQPGCESNCQPDLAAALAHALCPTGARQVA